jgi:hypothetical protein
MLASLQNHCRQGKAKYIMCACVHMCIALVIQHTKTSAIWSSVTRLTPPYFSTLFHKWHDFHKNFTAHESCVYIFSTTFI